jgi:AraC family transcriptional regulator, transcriptional activator of pobA
MRARSKENTTPLGSLPSFTLYGETGPPGQALLHLEPIDRRSSRYNWEIEAHVHQGLQQVLWVRAGNVQAVLDASPHPLTGPAMVVIPNGVAHAFRFNRGCDGHVLTLNASLLAEGEPVLEDRLHSLFSSPLAVELGSVTLPELTRLQSLFEALQAQCWAEDAVNTANAGSPVPVWLARALIWRLADCATTLKPAAGFAKTATAGQAALFSRWAALVEAHYGEHWPVSRYGEQLGLTPERLNRLVRAQTGLTAQVLLHARLLREATRRLVHTAAPVSKLAFELGFEDPAYFCRFFKKQTGLSPRAYREQAVASMTAPNA